MRKSLPFLFTIPLLLVVACSDSSSDEPEPAASETAVSSPATDATEAPSQQAAESPSAEASPSEVPADAETPTQAAAPAADTKPTQPPAPPITPSSSAAAPMEATIRLVGRTYAPDHVTVATGGTANWVWVSDGHSLISDGPQFFASQEAFWPGGSTYAIKFDTVGTYHFHCGVHAGMGGTVTVVEPG